MGYTYSGIYLKYSFGTVVGQYSAAISRSGLLAIASRPVNLRLGPEYICKIHNTFTCPYNVPYPMVDLRWKALVIFTRYKVRILVRICCIKISLATFRMLRNNWIILTKSDCYHTTDLWGKKDLPVLFYLKVLLLASRAHENEDSYRRCEALPSIPRSILYSLLWASVTTKLFGWRMC